MKKVVILTTSTGQGHNQAASSLCDAFQREGIEAKKIDFLASNSVVLNKTVVLGYEIGATKLPKIYGLLYKISNIKIINSLLAIPTIFTQRKLHKLLLKENPDVVISTHPLAINMLSRLKNKGYNTPYISIVTDFKAHNTYVSKNTSYYITGSQFTKDDLVNKGIDSSIIYPKGIPIREAFYVNSNYVKKENEYFKILLMGGSMGLNKISVVLDEVLHNKNKIEITVVCGKNEYLKNTLDKINIEEFKDKNLNIIGFTTEVPKLMEETDLIISKPGGLTVTEAIVKNVPILIPFVIPGQETENTEFLSQNKLAMAVKIKEINSKIDYLIKNPKILEEYRANLKMLSSTYDGECIINLTEALMNKEKNPV